MSDFVFSEHGEDILIHRLLLWKERGFYVDCGAYHARSMSLTARLRLFGWKGMNVDIDRKVIEDLLADASGTQSVCAALGESDGVEATFYRYADPVLNTIQRDQHDHLQRIELKDELFTSFVGTEIVRTTCLRTLLSSHQGYVDFLNVDVEGAELAVLNGFPWERYKPAVVAVEIHRLDLPRCLENGVVNYMYKVGYVLQSYVFHTAIFCLREFDTESCHRVSAKRL